LRGRTRVTQGHQILPLHHLAASVFAAVNKFYIVWRRETFDRKAASGRLTAHRSWWGCVGFNFSRILLNVVHIFVLLTASWLIVLLCAAVACVTLFYFVDEATRRAMASITTAEEVLPLFARTHARMPRLSVVHNLDPYDINCAHMTPQCMIIVSFTRVYRDGVWFGCVGFAPLLAIVLCWVDGCFGSWVLLGLFCLLRVMPPCMWFHFVEFRKLQSSFARIVGCAGGR